MRKSSALITIGALLFALFICLVVIGDLLDTQLKAFEAGRNKGFEEGCFFSSEKLEHAIKSHKKIKIDKTVYTCVWHKTEEVDE